MDTRSLDDIIAKAIPMLPGDCKRSKSKKEWMREEAKKRIIQWAELYVKAMRDNIKITLPDPATQDTNRTITFASGGTISNPFERHDVKDRPQKIIPKEVVDQLIKDSQSLRDMSNKFISDDTPPTT